MKQRLQEVRIEDFDITALRRAVREGRLYVVPAPECKTNIEHEVLRYVSRIAEQVAPQYQGCIDEVWRRIVNHPDLAKQVGSMCPFNKYTVTSIAIFLNNKGMYTFSSGTALHLQLENITERNKYYTSRAYYEPNTMALRNIVNEVRKEANRERKNV